MANLFSFFAVVIVGKPSNGKNSSYYGNWFYLIWPKSPPDINIDDWYIKVYYLNDKSLSNFVKKHFQFKFYLIQNLSNCYIFFLFYNFCNIKMYYWNDKSFNNFVKNIFNLSFIWYKTCQIVIYFFLFMSSVI